VLKVAFGASLEELLPTFVNQLESRRNLATILESALTPEWVITPSLGVRSWLVKETASHLGAGEQRTDGIVANWLQEFPSKLISRVLDGHLQRTTGLEVDPWGLPQLQFLIFEWAHLNPSHPGAALVQESSGAISLSRCRQLADLFDRYLTWRPEMVQKWMNGETATESQDEATQAETFVAVRNFVGVPCSAERWDEAWSEVDLIHATFPVRDRINIFGLSSLPGGLRYVEALSKLSTVMDVNVFLVNPFSESMQPESGDREEFQTNALRMWGGAGLALRSMGDAIDKESKSEPITRPQLPKESDNLLEAIQYTLRSDVFLNKHVRDASVIMHEAHGESRQAEVLRDAILHELEETDATGGPKITESEILVVCPNLKRFEPLIRAAFGAPRTESADQPRAHLAYRIADRSISHDGLYLQAVRHLLAVVKSRCSRSEVLGLLSEPAIVRTRNLSGDSSELFAEWSSAANIRWGLNAEHRTQFDLGALGALNTWKAGIQRLSLGAMIENPRLRASRGVLPVEVAPAHFDDLVALASVIHDLEMVVTESWVPKKLEEWLQWLQSSSRKFVTPGPDEVREFERVLSSLEPLRRSAPFNAHVINFRDFMLLVDEAFGSIGSLGAIFTGGITVTSPGTLPGIGFKSIYIAGFDDDAFTAADWDSNDLRKLSYEPGDIRPPDEARGQLRQVILSAQQRLVMIRNGSDVTTNKAVDHGIALSEFFDLTAELLEGEQEILTVTHPRNGFSIENFVDSSTSFAAPLNSLGVIKQPWSYSDLNFDLSAHRARTPWALRNATPSVSNASTEALSIQQLEDFLLNPPKVFARESLGVSLPDLEVRREDELDAEVDSLLSTIVLRKLWEEERADIDLKTETDLLAALESMETSGEVPPEPILNPVPILEVAELRAEYYRDGVARGNRRHVKVALPIGDSLISASVDVIEEPEATTLVEVMTSKLSVQRMLPIWLRVLAVRAVTPGEVILHLVYQPVKTDDKPVQMARIPVTGEPALASKAIAEIITLYRANLLRPIPFAAGDKLKVYLKPSLPEDRWTYTEFKPDYYAKYLGDPYWKLSMAHLGVHDIMSDTSPTSFRAVFPKIRELMDSVFPLFTFIEKDGNING